MLTPFASPLNEGKAKRGGRDIALKRNTQISSVGLTQFFSQAHVDWIYSSHGLDQILPSKLDLDCPFRLQHTTSGNRKDLSEERQGIKKNKNLPPFLQSSPAVLVGVHLHVPGVDGGIYNDPGASSQLSLRGDINQYWLLVLSQPIHNVGPEFQHLVVHI